MSAFIGSVLGGLPGLVTVCLGISAALILMLAVWRKEWEVPIHACAATLLGVVAWAANDRVWWLAVVAVVNIAGGFAWAPIADSPLKILHQQLSMNLVSCALSCRDAVANFRKLSSQLNS